MNSIKNYSISIKGYISKEKIESITNKKYSDSPCTLKYGCISFTGTEQEMNDFCCACHKDESDFKIIGIYLA